MTILERVIALNWCVKYIQCAAIKGLRRISTQVNAKSSEVALQLLIDTFDEFGNKLSQSNNKDLQYIH